jgi:hypothetical protein
VLIGGFRSAFADVVCAADGEVAREREDLFFNGIGKGSTGTAENLAVKDIYIHGCHEWLPGFLWSGKPDTNSPLAGRRPSRL